MMNAESANKRLRVGMVHALCQNAAYLDIAVTGRKLDKIEARETKSGRVGFGFGRRCSQVVEFERKKEAPSTDTTQ
jgi:hypothetical protein